ncbi:hypothetical protein D3C72_2010850 [compost metagenome]
MADCLYRLRHNTIISSHNDNRNIRYLCTAGTHGCERFVTRCIKECNLLVVNFNLVSTDMLGNPACLASGYVSRADGIEQRSFTMVNVTHDGNNRRTFLQICFIVRFFQCFETIVFNMDFNFHFNAIVSCQELNRIQIQLLVNGCHNT